MAKKKKPARVDPYLSQAQLEASLQIDPQIAALTALLAGKRSDYINTRRVNASNARGIREAADRAGLQIAQAYGGDPTAPKTGSLLAALKGTADTPEEQAAYNRLAGEQAYSQGMFAEQANRAELGRQYSNQQARDEWMGAKNEINASYQDLLAQQGKLTAATYGKLLEARRERQSERAQQQAQLSQQERNSIRSSGYDPDTGRPIPGGPADVNDPRDQPKGDGKGRTGLKLATPEQHTQRSQYIGELINEAQVALNAAKKKGLSGKAARRYVADTLATEQRAQKVWVHSETGEKRLAPPPSRERDQWIERQTPDRPARPKDLWMTAALDAIFDQGLSRNTQERLQRRYSVRDLGFGQGGNYGLTYGERRKRFGRGRGSNLTNRSGSGGTRRGPQGLPG